MDIILLERIRNLGQLGETVSVKPGYARNFLIPHGKAIRATAENLQQFEKRRAALEKAAKEILVAAQKRAEAFKELTLELIRRTVGEEGKLYGSIGVQEVVEALVERGLEIEKREIDMPSGPIRSIGEYEVAVQLHSEVVTQVRVIIIAEK